LKFEEQQRFRNNGKFDDLPDALTEAESSLAMFRSVLQLHMFSDAMFCLNDFVLLADDDQKLV
jgi:hypothetical protein